jgi:hypothetical protein
MRSLLRLAAFVGILALAVGGCTSGNSSLPTTTGAPASNQGSRHQQSWMAREASSEDLLYIVDSGLGGVVVYSYTPPKYKVVGFLANSSYGRICVDSAQNVLVTISSSVVEFKHGATLPFRILGGLPGYAGGCAVDSTSGTLAVPNEGGSSQTAAVSFFKKNSGRHTNIPIPEPYKIEGYCAYDGSGNLFVGAVVLGGQPRFALLELPRNSKKFVEIALDESLDSYVSGGIAWDGKYLDIADTAQNIVYQFAIKGRKGSTNATISLQRSYNIGEFFIEGTTIIVPAYTKPISPSKPALGVVNFYNYPGGGKKTGVIRGSSYPSGLIVSLGKGNTLTRRTAP